MTNLLLLPGGTMKKNPDTTPLFWSIFCQKNFSYVWCLVFLIKKNKNILKFLHKITNNNIKLVYVCRNVPIFYMSVGVKALSKVAKIESNLEIEN